MRTRLTKPSPDSKCGIRLTGTDHARIVGLSSEGLAALAGHLQVTPLLTTSTPFSYSLDASAHPPWTPLSQVGDVLLRINGSRAENHEVATRLLRAAVGPISIEYGRERSGDTSARDGDNSPPPPATSAAAPVAADVPTGTANEARGGAVRPPAALSGSPPSVMTSITASPPDPPSGVSLAVHLSHHLEVPKRQIVAAIFATGVPVFDATPHEARKVLAFLGLEATM